MNHRKDIDGLRAIAVLAVVLHHLLPEDVPGGYVGVDVFFVISGFLITRNIRDRIEAGTFTFGWFYERRVRRIFPAMFVMLAVTLVIAHYLLLPSDLRATLGAAGWMMFFSSNIEFWRELKAGYFAADASLNPLLHTWSLSVEEQFYLFFPPLLLLVHRFMPRHIVAALVCVSVVSLAASFFFIASKPVAMFFLTPFRAWELLAGSLLAYQAAPPPPRGRMREVFAWSGIAAILVPCFTFTPLTPFPGPAAVLPVLGTAAVMHCAPGTSIERVLSFGWVQYTGRISYSLYLWHWPLIVFARYATGMQPASHFAVPLLVGSFALAALSYRFVELPFHKRGISNRRDIFRGASIATAATLAFCIIMIGTRAYEDRFSPQVLAFDRLRHPEVPFTRCVGVELSKACTVGSEGTPTVVLWGDSHMLAWVPALDHALRAANQSAIVAVASSCPPFKDLSRMRASPECLRTAGEFAAMLRDRPEISTVVMGAIWSSYLGGESNTVQPPTPYASPDAPQALADTVGWLVQTKRKVVVLGPVPIFDANVPLMLALESHTGQHRLHTEAERERERNREFFDVARSFDPSITVVDPIPWLCTPACAPQVDGQSLYRDAHHLSEAGALHIAGKLHSLFASTTAP